MKIRKKNHMSLSTRVSLYLAGVLMAVLMLSTFLNMNELYKDYLQSLKWRSISLGQNLRDYTADLRGYTPEMQRTLGLSIACESLLENNRMDGFIYVGVADTSGMFIAHSDADKIGMSIPMKEIQEAVTTVTVTTLMGPDELKTMIPVDGRTYNSVSAVIVIGYSRDLINQKIVKTILYNLLLFIFFQILSYFIIRTIIHRIITEPLQQITDAAVDFSLGNQSSQFRIRNDEVGVLADNFLMMQEKIQEHFTALNDEIIHRKKAEETINSLEAKQRAMISNISDVIIILNREEEVIYVSPNITGIFNWTAQKVLNHFYSDFIHLDDQERVKSMLEDLLFNNLVQTSFECRFKRGEEIYVPIQVTGSNRFDDPHIGGLLLNFHDISERKKAEDNLLQAQKMESIGILARGIAHDFNNMLGGVFMASDMLRNHVVKDPEGIEYLDMINSSVQHAANLSSELLTFSRQKTVERKMVDVHGILSDTVNILGNTIDKRIEITMDLKAQNYKIMGDKSQIQSIFLNMGINAFHAIEGKGFIKFSSSNIFLSREFCHLSPFDLQPGDFIKIQIEDSGSGIPDGIIHKIFDPFFTTKELGKGTGLGLSASLGTIQLHKGMVEVKSQKGVGTTFMIYLPLIR